ncbi:unnamed protein product, partial [Staurois parvus]
MTKKLQTVQGMTKRLQTVQGMTKRLQAFGEGGGAGTAQAVTAGCPLRMLKMTAREDCTALDRGTGKVLLQR